MSRENLSARPLFPVSSVKTEKENHESKLHLKIFALFFYFILSFEKRWGRKKKMSRRGECFVKWGETKKYDHKIIQKIKQHKTVLMIPCAI